MNATEIPWPRRAGAFMAIVALVFAALLAASAASAAPPPPKVTAVSAGYAGSGLFLTAKICDRSVHSRVRMRVTWRAYRVDDGTLWKRSRSTFVTSSRCSTAQATMRNAPQMEYHYAVVTVSNLATGRSTTRRSRTGIVA